MTASRIPALGTKESRNLEFKAAESLRSPAGRRKIAREVVGMLNDDGGRILIGLGEQAGALFSLDPLMDAERPLADSLRDTLVDVVEPRLRSEDCRLEWIALDGGGSILEVTVPRPRRNPVPPFCVREGDARVYVTRIGDRLRPMSYQELLGREESPAAQQESWFQQVLEAGIKHYDVRSHPSFLLVLGVQDPSSKTSPVLASDALQLAISPPASVARTNGWSFHAPHGRTPRWKEPGKILIGGDEEYEYRQFYADHRGRLFFRTRLEHLQWNLPEAFLSGPGKQGGAIYPYALAEMTVSVMRFAQRLWAEQPPESDVYAAMLLTGTKDWHLPPCGPDKLAYRRIELWSRTSEPELLAGPHRLPAASFQANPDALAFELLAGIYDRFDYSSDRIPWFDQSSLRFTAES